MSDQHTDLVSKKCVDGLIKQMPANVRVDSTKWVVQQVNVCVDIEATSQVDSGLLAPAEGNTSFTHSRLITVRKETEISFQSCRLDYFIIPLMVVVSSAKNVLSNGSGKYPRLLGGIRNFASYCPLST